MTVFRIRYRFSLPAAATNTASIRRILDELVEELSPGTAWNNLR